MMESVVLIGRLGISTCYDVRFPEMYIQLVQQGAQVILVPAAFTVPTGKAHWHTLMKGKASFTVHYWAASDR
jgi:deaminated glutathione amidase